MHITADCPHCDTRYQLDASLRGKKMRCPNPTCRKIFEVGSKPGASQSVNDMIPMLTADVVEEQVPMVQADQADAIPMLTAEPVVPDEAPPQFASWHQPPPVRGEAPKPKEPERRAEPPVRTPTPSTSPPEFVMAEEPAPAPDLPLQSWDAPPVVEQAYAEPISHIPATDPTHSYDDEYEHARRKARRARRLMVGIVLGLLVFLGGGAGVAWVLLSQTEDSQAKRARKEYDDERLRESSERYANLIEKFPESTRLKEYQFFQEIATVRIEILDNSITTDQALDRAEAFLKKHSSVESKELMADHVRDLGQTLVKRVETFLEQNADSEEATVEGLMSRVESSLGDLYSRFPTAITREETMRIGSRIGEFRNRLALLKQRKEALEALRALVPTASATTIRQAKSLIAQRASIIPGFADLPEVQQLLGDLQKAHLEQTRYLPAGNAERNPGETAEDSESVILVDPLLAGRPRANSVEPNIVLALSRGVLYALTASQGEIRWALRVGIDTAYLPLRLPPTPANPSERILVLSTDTRTLRVLDLNGQQLWSYQLSAPSLGRPVLYNRRDTLVAFLSTYDGQVHEIDLTSGTLKGRYELGQSLSVGGVHQKGTSLIYFPADDSCIYVLDVERRKCEAILYTNHPAGSLRGEPLILGDDDAARNEGNNSAFLMLNLAGDLDSTVLRLYPLPVADANTQPVAIKPVPRFRGWTWFSSYHDGEKVVALSDAGRLGLFGIRQPRNQDSPLFPLIPGAEEDVGQGYAGLDLFPLLFPANARPSQDRSSLRGRSMVAHVEGEELWVLAQGQLQRVMVELSTREGPRATSVWNEPLSLGSPLHGPQILDSAARSTLFLVTQPLKRPITLVSAIRPDALLDVTAEGDPRVLWQRQLGLLCQGEPMPLTSEVLALDQGGGLFRFQPDKFPSTSTGWQVGGQAVFGSADLNPLLPSRLIKGEKNTIFQIASEEEGLLLRQYTPAKEPGGPPSLKEERLPLRGVSLAGDPVLMGNTLLVPLNDGRLVRYGLPLGAKPAEEQGPNWRSRREPQDSRCFLVVTGPDEFVTSDGGRGLTRYRWPLGQRFFERILPPTKRPQEPPTVELPDRLAFPPLVLPRTGEGTPLRLLVVDVRGAALLLSGDYLAPTKTWDLGGRPTSPAFLRGGQIGCIADGNRLVWLDPAQSEPLWSFSAEGSIVGQPQLIDGVLLVCDEGGRFVGLNPSSGKPQGKGYQLKTAVAPVASPVPFGSGRAFAPLTDGTVMLLSMKHFQNPPAKPEK